MDFGSFGESPKESALKSSSKSEGFHDLHSFSGTGFAVLEDFFARFFYDLLDTPTSMKYEQAQPFSDKVTG